MTDQKTLPLLLISTTILTAALMQSSIAAASTGDCLKPSLTELRRDHSASIKEAQERAKALLAKRGQTRGVLHNPMPAGFEGDRLHPEDWGIEGVPEKVRLVETQGRTFRHYVPDLATAKKIQEAGTLRSGTTPYVEVAPGVYKKTYSDLSGIFITNPEASAYSVGVKSNSLAIDLKIPEGVPVLQLEKNIFLIPLKPNYHDWIKNLYRKFKAGETLTPTDRAFCEKIEQAGGITENPGEIPIEITAIQK